MPYLDSKIEKHHKGCVNPVGKRLYIRDYDDEGKQKFVSWGLTCTTCGVVVKEKYERGLTPKEQAYVESEKAEMASESESEKILKKKLGVPSTSWQEMLEWKHKHKLRNKQQRLLRKQLGPEPMDSTEVKYRTGIKNLKEFYRLLPLWADDESLNGIWDENLVIQFLYLAPRPTLHELTDVFYGPRDPETYKKEFVIPLDPAVRRRLRGMVPDPTNEKPNRFKYDKEAYKKLLKSETQKRMELMQQIIKSREGKQ